MELRIDYNCLNHHCSGFPSFSYFLILSSIAKSSRGNVGFCTLPLKSAQHNRHVVSGVVEAATGLSRLNMLIDCSMATVTGHDLTNETRHFFFDFIFNSTIFLV